MNKIIINGKSIATSGTNITVNNNTVYVNGRKIEDGLEGIVKIEFQGDLASLQSCYSVEVNGNIHGKVGAGTSVRCKDVYSDVTAGTSIKCDEVQGSVDAGTSIHIKR